MGGRRMRVASAASGVGFGVTLVLCVGSLFVNVYRISPPDGRGWEWWQSVLPGGYLCRHVPPSTTLWRPPTQGWVVRTNRPPRFGLIFSRPLVRSGPVYMWVPFWLPLGLFAVLPATNGVRRWRARRAAARIGCCVRCGYDLRATPGRCPECGTAAGPGAL